MVDTHVGLQIRPEGWWRRLTARFRTTANRPAWHAPAGPAGTRPGGGKHRRSDGGNHDYYRLPDGRWITFTRRP